MAKKIIGVGSPLVDILARVSHEHVDNIDGDKGGMCMVEFDQLQGLLSEVPEQELATGGSASNTIVGLLKLGVAGAFLGKLGEDERGQYFLDSFVKAGGSEHAFKRCPETPTGTCLSLVTPDAERTMRPYLGAAAGLLVEEVSASDFEGQDHVHLEGYLLFNRELALQTFKAAKEAGCTVSVDLASFEVVNANQDVLPDLLENYVDMVFANEEEAKAFCGSDDPHVAIESLAKHCPIVAVKLGADGAWVQRDGEKVFVGAHKVEAIDTTGAGDLWASGFLYGLAHDLSLEQSAKLAHKIGSEVVQVMGAVIPEAGWDRISTTLEEYCRTGK